MQLRHDHALGAVDDERAVARHQRDVAKVDLLLLDVPDGLDTSLGVLVPDHEADGHLEGHGVGHTPLLTLFDVVLELEGDCVPAHVAHRTADLVGLATRRADQLPLAHRVGLEHRPAARAGLTQVMKTGQPSALAVPVPDRVLDELERRVLSKVADRKHRLEHGLQPSVVTLAG